MVLCTIGTIDPPSLGDFPLLIFQQSDQIGNRPFSVREPGLDGGCRAERLVSADEIVVEVVQGDGVGMVRQLLTESVCQPRVATIAHPQG